jgi:predicted S18 family serine protease
MKIVDDLIKPFEIHIDSNSYIVGKVSINKKGESVFNSDKYYTSLASALKYISREKVRDNNNTMSLNTYVNSINETFNLLKNSLENVK